jgi:hypothetical protein
MSNGDTAKKQSWMSSLEFKRIAFSNEIQFQAGVTKVDGNLVKRMASGGDTVEVCLCCVGRFVFPLLFTLLSCLASYSQILKCDSGLFVSSTVYAFAVWGY